ACCCRATSSACLNENSACASLPACCRTQALIRNELLKLYRSCQPGRSICSSASPSNVKAELISPHPSALSAHNALPSGTAHPCPASSNWGTYGWNSSSASSYLFNQSSHKPRVKGQCTSEKKAIL